MSLEKCGIPKCLYKKEKGKKKEKRKEQNTYTEKNETKQK